MRKVPVGLPDVDGLFVHVVVLQRLLIQEVKEVLDGWRHHGPGAQNAPEEIVHKLLQRSLGGVKHGWTSTHPGTRTDRHTRTRQRRGEKTMKWH